MDPITIDAGDLAPLKTLAGELLAADSVDLGMLDRIGALAADLATRGREQARRQMLDLVEARALPLFAAAGDDLRARLTPLALDELSALAALLDTAVTARAAFEEADSGLMAARRRGDYAAMAPLALEADAQKNALESATTEVAERLGLAGAVPELPPADEPAAASAAEPEPAEPASAAAASEDGAAAPEAEGQEALPERRRLRALIRQMRPAAEEASGAR
jgi:hypothetical protein